MDNTSSSNKRHDDDKSYKPPHIFTPQAFETKETRTNRPQTATSDQSDSNVGREESSKTNTESRGQRDVTAKKHEKEKSIWDKTKTAISHLFEARDQDAPTPRQAEKKKPGTKPNELKTDRIDTEVGKKATGKPNAETASRKGGGSVGRQGSGHLQDESDESAPQ